MQQIAVSDQEALNAIRSKVKNRQTDFSKTEKDCLKVVYEEIQAQVGTKRKLNTSCSSCVVSAMNIVYNYIMHHEVNKNSPVKENAKVTRVSVSDNLADLSLRELRERYPSIKATSKAKFIEQIPSV